MREVFVALFVVSFSLSGLVFAQTQAQIDIRSLREEMRGATRDERMDLMRQIKEIHRVSQRTAAPEAAPGPAVLSLSVTNDIGLSSNSNIFKGGTAFLWSDATNLGLGQSAMTALTTGIQNTALGNNALSSNLGGQNNTAVGSGALQQANAGNNVAMGSMAMYSQTTGADNVAIGFEALAASTVGSSNTAVGRGALSNLTGTEVDSYYGYQNTAVGTFALGSNDIGAYNTAIGSYAGYDVGDDARGNIIIGAQVRGEAGDNNVIRLGDDSNNRTFIGGIRGISTGVADAIPVVVDSLGQLGTVSSSRRYKEDIAELGSTSDRLLALRTVSFRFKEAFNDGGKPLQYGLIAEEVAEVFPELVVYDDQGRPDTVKYHLLSTLLVNELQKQQDLLAELLIRVQILESSGTELGPDVASIETPSNAMRH